MTGGSPSDCPAWRRLGARAAELGAVHLRELFASDAARGARFVARAPGLRLDYSRQRLDANTLQLLQTLALERELPQWRAALFEGAPINATEQRPALHPALRAGSAAPAAVQTALARMRELTGRLREGLWLGASGRPIRRVVNLGTGGSDLGPRLLVDALAEEHDSALEFAFASNVDPLDLARALRGADAHTTLFVVVSKTFTTQETMQNAHAARTWLAERLPAGSALERHFVAVTGNEDAARAFGVAEVLPVWDWAGGRYSVWSPVGFTAMCALGADRFGVFLAGGADIDRHFAEAPLPENVPTLMALLGIWNVNFLGSPTHAVLPYSTALRLFPAYLQQLEMESNGKSVDRDGRNVNYATAPVVWGAEGTVGQHSFHQLLHQGTQIVPADFIVFDLAPGDAARRDILAAHAAAQAEALAFGRAEPALPPHRQFPGNRPSTTLAFERLDARALGRLIALYEHKVFVQGIIWNLNSFDQWGVELGKELAARRLGSAVRA